MRIYLLGSSGFIGQNMARRWQDHEIMRHQKHSNLSATLEAFEPNLILNCAAEIYDPLQMFETNVNLVRVCLDYCRNQPATQFIQLGSSSEYGPMDRATCERDAARAVDMYSGTKSAATLLCQAYAAQHRVDVQVIRPYSPYGPGERPHRLFPALWRAFKLDQPMQLSQGVHDFCYIDDLVDAIIAVSTSAIRQPGEIINVSSGIQYTNGEVLETFRQITGKLGNVELVERFTTPKVWQANIEHVQNKYAWTPRHSLAAGVRRFLEEADYE